MDMLALLRTLGGLGTVLGLLAGALWVVRRYDLRLPGRAVSIRDRRLELVETLSIDARRVVALVRRDGREHLLLIAPEGHLVLETGLMRDDVDQASEDARRAEREAKAAARASVRSAEVPQWPVEGFAALVDRERLFAGRALVKLQALRRNAACTMAQLRQSWRSASAGQPARFRQWLAAADDRIPKAAISIWTSESLGAWGDRARIFADQARQKLQILHRNSKRSLAQLAESWRLASARQPAGFSQLLAAARQPIPPAAKLTLPPESFGARGDDATACAAIGRRASKAPGDRATAASVETPLARPLDPTVAVEAKHVGRPSTVGRRSARKPAGTNRMIAPETNLA